MRIQAGLGLLIAGAALTGCTATAPPGPDVTVSTPSVGRPQPPASAQAALSRMAFTPYAALGEADNDGLAPGASDFALASACMTAAGYPGSGNIPVSISLSQAGLSFGQPWGAWGYLGDAVAQQYGFRMQPGSVAGQLGIDLGAAGGQDPGTLPQAEQDAIGRCSTITGDFDDAMGKGPLAGIAVLTNDVYDDVLKDQAVKDATQTWTACMARNGYHLGQPDTVFGQETRLIYGGTRASPTATVSPEVNRAQIATAVTDASCTDSSDLAGIYFAVQASYEQQIVNANQQALTAAVQQYRAAYAKELKKLPTLLKTAKANPVIPAKR